MPRSSPPSRAASVRPVIVLFLVAITIGVILLRGEEQTDQNAAERRAVSAGCSQVVRAFRGHESGVWLDLSARVIQLLPDAGGTRTHQRFVVRCLDGQTVLIVNDVTVGERAPVTVGASVAVRGQYIWNGQGGLIHFTHHATGGGQNGFIVAGGRLYSLGPRPNGMNQEFRQVSDSIDS